MITFSSILAMPELPNDSGQRPDIGTISGGALVPGRLSCQCCGTIAALNCGTIKVSFYGENQSTWTHRDYFEFIDSGDLFIGENKYVAALTIDGAVDGCEPTVQISVDQNYDDLEFGGITVSANGVGTAYYQIYLGGQFLENAEAVTRPGVVMASAAGNYGDDEENGYYITVGSSTPTAWRVLDSIRQHGHQEVNGRF